MADDKIIYPEQQYQHRWPMNTKDDDDTMMTMRRWQYIVANDDVVYIKNNNTTQHDKIITINLTIQLRLEFTSKYAGKVTTDNIINSSTN